MTQRIQKILSVNTTDLGGGAEQVAWTLFKGFQSRGLESWLIVGDKKRNDSHIMCFFDSPHIDYRPYADHAYQSLIQRRKEDDVARGIEDFHFPYTKLLPDITGSKPDIILAHNLHGGYFDLCVLPELSQNIPTFLILHDTWTMTGHCAQPIDCPGSLTGCGNCPDLSRPPAVRADATSYNWLRKKEIFSQSKLYISSPSEWMLGFAKFSLLAPAIADARVIPCPVDLRQFCPVMKWKAKLDLGLQNNGEFLLVAAVNRMLSNPYKDFATLQAAMEKLVDLMPETPITFMVLGPEEVERQVGNIRIRFLPKQPPAAVAQYLQAADVFVHAVTAETFGLVVAEAMACGTPVVATAAGGLTELIQHDETGLLVPRGDPQELAHAIARLLNSPSLRARLGENAVHRACNRFNKEHIIDQYLTWFQRVCQEQESTGQR